MFSPKSRNIVKKRTKTATRERERKREREREREREGGGGGGEGKKGRKKEIIISDSNQVPTSHSIVAESLTKLIPNDEKNRNRELTKLTLYNNIHKTIMMTSNQ